ncbi:MAG TPA: amidohydrolase family protein [Candidatus Binatia bacterium]|nr:amidohydrolase family protein [Candidatus Binatia bacterium]
MWLLISFLVLACWTVVPASIAQERSTVLEVGLLIDGSGDEPIKDAVIVIEGKRVKAVGRKGAVKIPQGARVVQAGDKTAFPGLIDSHVHYKEWQGELYLNHGVTTALVIGSEPIEWIVTQKEGIAKGKIVGPRIFAAGPHLNSPREGERSRRSARDEISRLRFEVQAKTAEDARKAVRELHGQGADIIKIFENSTPEVIRAATAEAKQLGLPAGGHSIDVYMSGENGFTFVEHSHAIVATSIKDPKKRQELHTRRTSRRNALSTPEFHYYAEPENFDEIVRFMVERNIHWGPTIATTWRALTPKRARHKDRELSFLKEPGLVYIPSYFRANVESHFNAIEKITDQEFLKRCEVGYEKLSEFIRRFVKAGGKIHTGSDPNSVLPAWGVHTELEMLVDMGLSPMEALLAATRNPAEMMGKQSELGVIKPGSFADLVVVDGNPLQDIAKTRSIKMVFKEGNMLKLGYNKEFRNPIPRPFPDRPEPEIDDISPKVITQPDAPVILKVTGDNFLRTAVVTLDGKPLTTKAEMKSGGYPENFERAREVTATIDPKSIQQPGTYRVNVVHDGMGGAVSNSVYLVVKFK